MFSFADIFVHYLYYMTNTHHYSMPITKAARGREPNWKDWDQKAQKSGLRHTVFCGGGDTYVGHWENNLKHGKGRLLIV